VDKWRAGTRDQCRNELEFNAPLPSPSSYFGRDFVQGNEGQMTEWRKQVYNGKKGGPSIVLANEILVAAGAEIVPQAELPELIRTRVAAPNTRHSMSPVQGSTLSGRAT
jgi:hypothetical protein